jgi:hypothetical protein
MLYASAHMHANTHTHQLVCGCIKISAALSLVPALAVFVIKPVNIPSITCIPR